MEIIGSNSETTRNEKMTALFLMGHRGSRLMAVMNFDQGTGASLAVG